MIGVLSIDQGFKECKVGIYQGEPDVQKALASLSVFTLDSGQSPFERFWQETGSKPSIVVIPGGSYRPSRAGCFWLNGDLANEASYIDFWHPRNQATIMAYRYCLENGVPGLVVEPMNTAEFLDEATFSGVKDYWRRGVFYALPQRIAFKLGTEEIGKPLRNSIGVTVYLGEESCVSSHKGLRVIDSSDPIMGEGPFGFRSAGTLPATAFIDHMSRGGLGERPIKKLKEESGLLGYLGSDCKDISQVGKEITDGRKDAVDAVNAMAYQISKEIGRQIVACQGRVDLIALCGPGARLASLSGAIKARVSKWGQVFSFPEDLVIPTLIKEGILALNGKSIKKYKSR